MLKDIGFDIDQLESSQKSYFSCFKNNNGELEIKKDHSHYTQCQVQMEVVGFTQSLYCI